MTFSPKVLDMPAVREYYAHLIRSAGCPEVADNVRLIEALAQAFWTMGRQDTLLDLIRATVGALRESDAIPTLEKS